MKEKTNFSNEANVNITFRDFQPCESIKYTINEYLTKLGQLKESVISWEFVLSRPHPHAHKRAAYHVEIRAHVAGDNIIINREPEKNDLHADIYIALRDAFGALERKLESYIRKHSGKTKKHRVARDMSHIKDAAIQESWKP